MYHTQASAMAEVSVVLVLPTEVLKIGVATLDICSLRWL